MAMRSYATVPPEWVAYNLLAKIHEQLSVWDKTLATATRQKGYKELKQTVIKWKRDPSRHVSAMENSIDKWKINRNVKRTSNGQWLFKRGITTAAELKKVFPDLKPKPTMKSADSPVLDKEKPSHRQPTASSKPSTTTTEARKQSLDDSKRKWFVNEKPTGLTYAKVATPTKKQTTNTVEQQPKLNYKQSKLQTK